MSEKQQTTWVERVLAYVERKEQQEVVEDRQEVEAWLY
mgnify:CR=1 FL=1